MMDIVGFIFDIVLIGLLGVGISFAMKLVNQLKEMRNSRAEMERLVLAFNATVNRAEAGVQGLKSTSREIGDDLESLIDKGQSLRDELMFLNESADQLATRLSQTAQTVASRTPTVAKASEKAKPAPTPVKKKAVAEVSPIKPSQKTKSFSPSSAAEKELLRVLKKMG